MGRLDYSAPPAEKQVEDYELRVAFDNPYMHRTPPRQLDARLQAVARWEQAGNILQADRITKQQLDTDRYMLKDSTQRWLVNMRFQRIVAEQSRPSIAGQLKKGAEQVEKDNAARSAPDKKSDKDR